MDRRRCGREESGVSSRIEIDDRTIGKIIKAEGLVREYRTRKLKYKYIKIPLTEGELVEIDIKYVPDLVKGKQYYQFTAIDCASRWRYLQVYDNMGNSEAMDFLRTVITAANFKIRAIKTDNGMEFLGDFDAYLNRRSIVHYFSYPRTPKSNAYIERFNRTIQEEFVDAHLDLFDDMHTFNDNMMDYLIYYNTVRPHKSLNYQTPMGFMISEDPKSNMLWTHTVY